MSKTVKRLYRGEHPLPHQCQAIRRDLDAELVGRHLGQRADGWRMSPEQLRERAERGERYEFIVHQPGTVTLAWTAFVTRAELDVFCAAYGCTLEPADPQPGARFTIVLPDSSDAFASLVESDEEYRLF